MNLKASDYEPKKFSTFAKVDMMKGRLASRAHSFKENLLGAFGHASPPSPNPGQTARPKVARPCGSHPSGPEHGATGRTLAKKTNSTDNLIEYSAPRTTECLVRELQFTLRFFEDAVSKGTYDLLPGCATVILETVLSLQSYAMAKISGEASQGSSLASRGPRRTKPRSLSTSATSNSAGASNELLGCSATEAKLLEAMETVCSTVAKLIQWADRVIVDGCVDPSEDYIHKVIEPVQKSVVVLGNLIGQHPRTGFVNKSTSLHNSLPDIVSNDPEEQQQSPQPPRLPARLLKATHTSRSADASDDYTDSPIRLLPPPLPPKHTKQSGLAPLAQLDEDDPFIADQNLDWFSNPLFDSKRQPRPPSKKSDDRRRITNKSSSQIEGDVVDFSQASIIGEVLETMIPDCTKHTPCPNQIAYIDTSPNISRDSLLLDAEPMDNGLHSTPLTAGIGGLPHIDDSSSNSSDIPPALPRKSSRGPPRKISQYDNVQPHHSPLTFAVSNPFPSSDRALPSLRSVSTLSSFQGRISPTLEQRPWSCLDGSNHPPPLPPKKRNIKSYMEMFGRSIIPNSDVWRSLAQTQDILQAVWQQNYHEFTDYYTPPSLHTTNDIVGLVRPHDQFFLAPQPPAKLDPLPRLLPQPAFTTATSSTGMPPPFPNFPDDYEEEDDTTEDTGRSSPPALPPKRTGTANRGKFYQPCSSDSVSARSSGEERVIPIVRESDGSVIICNRHRHKEVVETTGSMAPSNRLSCVSDSAASSSSSGLGTEIHSHRQSYHSNDDVGLSLNLNKLGRGSHQSSMTERQPKFTNQEPKKSPLKVTLPPQSSVTSVVTIKNKRNSSKRKKQPISSTAKDTSASVLESADVFQYSSELLSYNEDGSKELLRAGSIDALIVLATQSYKNDFLYQEAFVATYRTFLTTHILLEKLVHRFRRFNRKSDAQPDKQQQNKRVAHCAFSLLVRIVDGLADCDFQDTCVMELLTDFMSELVSDGELMLARALRTKFIQKYEDRRSRLLPDLDTSGLSLSSKPPSLLHFKSVDLAEQMTLLDAQLFMHLDAAELILWVQEQNEDKSPNLTKFTEHFNNMSYWCRTKILQQDEARERERLVMKFIKIMKWLRKYNNFNSYLALLSALDSAPIRRLEWQKSITEGLKEYCALIDSSSSFRAYRLALAESKPPCIPYVGLVLQDLTFVHIGNPDTFDNKVNFAKRWQQFNILDNLRRFKKETYHFKRRDDIIHFFANFEDFWSEDEMWDKSEQIKPRGQKLGK